MRGRTNITQRSGTVPVNGDIKEFTVANGEVINVGDFVTTITESVETNITSLNSSSSSNSDYSNRLLQREIGEINGKKVFYFYPSNNDFSNCLFVIKDVNGDVFSVLSYAPSRIYELGPACVIGNYIILRDCYDSSSSNNPGLKVLKLSDDLQTYEIVQNFKDDYTLGLFGIFKVSDSKFVTIYYRNDTLRGFALYSFNNGQITLLQYSTNTDIVKRASGYCYGIVSDDGNSVYITFDYYDVLYCATVKINGDSIESSNVISTKVSTHSSLTKICKLSSNVYFCLGSSDSLQVIMFSVSDSGNFGLKSVSSLTDLNESNYAAQYPVLTSNGDGSYFVLYIVSNFSNLRACKISFLNNSVNIDVKYGSLNSNYHKYYYSYLVDKSGDKYFIRYVQKYGNGSSSSINSSVYFITEMKAKTTGETIDLGGGLKVSSYNGKSIGFAKTGGTSGETIQVYVPKSN